MNARTEIELLLEDSPSLRQEVDAMIAKQSGRAAKLMEHDLHRHGEPTDVVWDRLKRGGFTAEQVLGDCFPPAPSS